MFLYELALALDVRSADLVAAAARRGIEGLTTATKLRPDQQELLRALVVELGPVGLAGLGGGRPGPLEAGPLGVDLPEVVAPSVAPGAFRRAVRRYRRPRAA